MAIYFNPANNPALAAMLAQQARANELAAQTKEEATESEEQKEETRDADSEGSKPGGTQKPPTLSQAQIIANANRSLANTVNKQVQDKFHEHFDQLNNFYQQQLANATKLGLLTQQQAADVQRTNPAQFNQGLRDFAASNAYAVLRSDDFKKRFSFGDDIFNTAEFVLAVIREKGDFKVDLVDMNAPGTREAFEVLNNEEKLQQVILVLQEATDHFMRETGELLNSPLKSEQAKAQISVNIAKAVLHAENRARAQALLVNSQRITGVYHLGTA